MFVLLQFAENGDSTVGVVHSSWLTPKKKKVYWPPVRNQADFDKAILKGIPPTLNNWGLYKVERIFNTYDNYKEAQRKAIIAEDTSDLSAVEESLSTQRRRAQKPLRYLDEDSDDDINLREESAFIRPPKIIEDKDCSTFQENLSSSQSTPNINPKTSSLRFNSRWTNISSSTPTSSRSRSTSSELASNETCRSNCTSFDQASQDVTLTNTTNNTAASREITECHSCKKYLKALSTIIEQNNQILTILKCQTSSLKQQSQISIDFPVQLPIETFEDLEVLENLLEDIKAPKKNWLDIWLVWTEQA